MSKSTGCEKARAFRVRRGRAMVRDCAKMQVLALPCALGLPARTARDHSIARKSGRNRPLVRAQARPGSRFARDRFGRYNRFLPAWRCQQGPARFPNTICTAVRQLLASAAAARPHRRHRSVVPKTWKSSVCGGSGSVVKTRFLAWHNDCLPDAARTARARY